MSYAHHLVDRVFLLKWTGAPTVEDVHSISRDLSVARQAAGQQLLYVGLIEAEKTGMPDQATRDAMSNTIGSIMEVCETVGLVVVGEGIKNILVSTLVRAMSLAGGKKKMVSYRSVAEALEKLAPQCGVSLSKLQQEARASGFLS